MQTTENYGFKKPEATDFYNIDEMVNDNMDMIDKQMKDQEKKIEECFQNVSDGKALVASAISDKGVTTAEDATFATMASNIEAIKTGGELQAKTATLDTANTSVTLTPDAGYDGLSKATVSITTQSKSAALSTSEQTITPDSGKVLAAVTVPAVTGTAAVGDVLAGKTFNSATAGIAKTGTLVDKTGTAEYTVTPALDSTNSELEMPIPATGKYNTSNKLKATFATIASLIGLTAAKIVKGNTILGITGNSNNMDTSGGDATAAQILSGKKACVDGSLITGTMTNRQGTTVDATAVSQDDTYTYFTTPAGSYSATSKVRTPNSNLINKITASGKVYSGSYAQFDVTNCKSVTYTLTANNGNGSGGNALVIDDTVKAYTKAFNASTLTASGTIDISDATKLQIRCYDNASTFDSGWGGNYTLEFN